MLMENKSVEGREFYSGPYQKQNKFICIRVFFNSLFHEQMGLKAKNNNILTLGSMVLAKW